MNLHTLHLRYCRSWRLRMFPEGASFRIGSPKGAILHLDWTGTFYRRKNVLFAEADHTWTRKYWYSPLGLEQYLDLVRRAVETRHRVKGDVELTNYDDDGERALVPMRWDSSPDGGTTSARLQDCELDTSSATDRWPCATAFRCRKVGGARRFADFVRPGKLRPRCSLGLGREPSKISEHGRDECLPAWVLRSQRSSKEVEKIARLPGGLFPIRRRRCDQLGFQLILPQAQRCFVGFHVGEQPAKVGRLLRRHAAMLV
jgi:hypothetical protein